MAETALYITIVAPTPTTIVYPSVSALPTYRQRFLHNNNVIVWVASSPGPSCSQLFNEGLGSSRDEAIVWVYTHLSVDLSNSGFCFIEHSVWGRAIDVAANLILRPVEVQSALQLLQITQNNLQFLVCLWYVAVVEYTSITMSVLYYFILWLQQ